MWIDKRIAAVCDNKQCEQRSVLEINLGFSAMEREQVWRTVQLNYLPFTLVLYCLCVGMFNQIAITKALSETIRFQILKCEHPMFHSYKIMPFYAYSHTRTHIHRNTHTYKQKKLNNTHKHFHKHAHTLMHSYTPIYVYIRAHTQLFTTKRKSRGVHVFLHF